MCYVWYSPLLPYKHRPPSPSLCTYIYIYIIFFFYIFMYILYIYISLCIDFKSVSAVSNYPQKKNMCKKHIAWQNEHSMLNSGWGAIQQRTFLFMIRRRLSFKGRMQINVRTQAFCGFNGWSLEKYKANTTKNMSITFRSNTKYKPNNRTFNLRIQNFKKKKALYRNAV